MAEPVDWVQSDKFVLRQLNDALGGNDSAAKFLTKWPATSAFVEPSLALRHKGYPTRRRHLL